ncbi:hypothetical protein LTR85_009040 [Meristemomyces frigidus]|nr:hypothetical protein LTR85_009040 [Meristemomyces frigidus]
MARDRWTLEQRILLWLLNTRFALTSQENAQLFDHIYAEVLSRYGYPDGMEVDKIRDEYNQRTTPAKATMWEEICDADGWRQRSWTSVGVVGSDEPEIGGERIKKAEERIAQGVVFRPHAPSMDPRVCNKAYGEAHPTNLCGKIKGRDPTAIRCQTEEYSVGTETSQTDV